MIILEKILTYVVMFFFVILLIPMTLGYFLYVPFDIIRYHRMPYYKDTKEKYRFFITSRSVVKAYNRIKKNDLSISYVENENFEYFMKDGTVLLCDWIESAEIFEDNDGEWIYSDAADGEYAGLYLKDILEKERKNLKKEHQKLPIKILVFYEEITDAERWENLKVCPFFACFFDAEEFT
ncbi:MAG: hypothetical protein ACI3X1_01275 [Eubacteriales bacterium]